MKLGWNAPIDDSAINHKTDYTTILYQASILMQQVVCLRHDTGRQIISRTFQLTQQEQLLHSTPHT
jgi:hypothetical protein